MKELLEHMLNGITGEEIDVTEETGEDGFITFFAKIPKEKVGIVIGKGGKTINALKNVLKVRAIRENARVDIQISEA